MGGSNQHDKNMTEGYFHTPPRKASDVTNASQPTTSSPMSNASSIQSLRESRPAQRIMPRTSSIDSAISSLSLAQTQKSFDANAVSAADIGNLVSAAGSAEAVIMHLLKEKHHAANQNSQLWRLVDKQRSLILGLNKDLERAMKEKDRYKKQAKELQSSVPPLPTADLQEIRPQTGERRDVSGTREKSKREDSSAGNIKGRGLNEGQGLSDFAPIGHTSLVQSRNHTENLVGSRRLSMSDPVSDERVSADHNLTFVGDKKDKIPHPNRKPPPAPLNLRHPEYTLTEQPDLYDSESDYEDISEVDGLSIERGRRKTREDDDREREAALEMSEEGRIGDREGNNISGNPNRHDGPAGLSSNLRQMTAQYLPAMERHEPAASILNPGMACAVSLNDRPLRSAPKSPGLPISPRPEDRPFGSALPRMPREAPNSLGPLRTPAGDNIAGLPVSPRVGRNQFQSHPNSPLVDNAVMRDNRAPSRGIYRGFMSEDYPHFLLPPNALPLIQVKVSSSRLRPSRNNYSTSRTSEEEPVFTLSIFSRSGNAELWRVEKVIAALPQLDQRIRQLSLFAGRLPDRSIFSGHSPVKVDARRAALNAYFEALLDTPMDERAASVICQFLSSDAIEPRDDETSLLRSGSQEKPEMLRGPDGRPTKEGYLTKRGKNFGGWKARYFVLHGPELKYFESPGGPHMGTIKLHHAQIGRQSEKMNPQSHSPSRVDDETENQYRHAFLILEPKRKDTSALVRHVLCAESDEERDAWVEALLEYVEGHLSENEGSNSLKGNSQTQEKQTTGTTPKSKLFSKGNSAKGINRVEMDTSETVQGFSYDDAVAAEPPVLGPSYESAKSPLDPAKGNSAIDQGEAASHPIISGPTNGAIIQDAGAWGNKAAAAAATITTKEKKRSIWGFRTRSSADLASQLQTSCDPPATPGSGSSPWADRKDIVRPVFGMPLGEAVQLCAPQGVDVDLPAVVYRSIEYLGTKGAASEEGIFRLSGSNVVVKSLKERFNTEGDVDLLADEQYYDVHAVASLFKQYLRELPTTVLTRELHLEFLRVLGRICTASIFLGANPKLDTFANRRRRT